MIRATRADVILPNWLLEKIQELVSKELGGCSIPAYIRSLIYQDLKRRGICTEAPKEAIEEEARDKAERKKQKEAKREDEQKGAVKLPASLLQKIGYI